MDLKETVDMHTKQLEQHDKELVELRENNAKEVAEIKEDINRWSKTLNDGLIRFDENNKFLQQQNREILSEIIGRNNKATAHKHELEKIKWQSVLKICLAIFGSGGAIYAIIDLALNIVK